MEAIKWHLFVPLSDLLRWGDWLDFHVLVRNIQSACADSVWHENNYREYRCWVHNTLFAVFLSTNQYNVPPLIINNCFAVSVRVVWALYQKLIYKNTQYVIFQVGRFLAFVKKKILMIKVIIKNKKLIKLFLRILQSIVWCNRVIVSR